MMKKSMFWRYFVKILRQKISQKDTAKIFTKEKTEDGKVDISRDMIQTVNQFRVMCMVKLIKKQRKN